MPGNIWRRSAPQPEATNFAGFIHLLKIFAAMEKRHRGACAEFGNGWTLDAGGKWHPLLKATFTASDAKTEAKDTVDAGVIGENFYLQTGGETHQSQPVGSKIERPATDAKPPAMPE